MTNKNAVLEIEQNPGKFEGEMKGIKFLWYLCMELGEDTIIYDNDIPVSIFYRESTNGDFVLETLFNDSPDTFCIALWESEQGFVHSEFMTENEFYTWRKLEE